MLAICSLPDMEAPRKSSTKRTGVDLPLAGVALQLLTPFSQTEHKLVHRCFSPASPMFAEVRAQSLRSSVHELNLYLGFRRLWGDKVMIRVRPSEKECIFYCLLHFESLVKCKMYPKSTPENTGCTGDTSWP